MDCLLDTNSIVKYYHDEPGSDLIKFLFDKSPTANISFLNIQVIEVISTFYTLRKKNKIKSNEDRLKLIDTFLNDIKNGKMKLYDFRTEHLIDALPVIDKVFTIPPPRRSRPVYIPWDDSAVQVLKDFADLADIALIIIMREIKYLVGEAYLFTSDGHVKEVAKSFDIKVIDPELIKPCELPPSLGCRMQNRISPRMGSMFKSLDHSQNLGSLPVFNISQGGVCVRRNPNLNLDRDIWVTLCSHNSVFMPQEKKGQVVWVGDQKVGIKFDESLELEKIQLLQEHCMN